MKEECTQGYKCKVCGRIYLNEYGPGITGMCEQCFTEAVIAGEDLMSMADNQPTVKALKDVIDKLEAENDRLTKELEAERKKNDDREKTTDIALNNLNDNYQQENGYRQAIKDIFESFAEGLRR